MEGTKDLSNSSPETYSFPGLGGLRKKMLAKTDWIKQGLLDGSDLYFIQGKKFENDIATTTTFDFTGPKQVVEQFAAEIYAAFDRVHAERRMKKNQALLKQREEEDEEGEDVWK